MTCKKCENGLAIDSYGASYFCGCPLGEFLNFVQDTMEGAHAKLRSIEQVLQEAAIEQVNNQEKIGSNVFRILAEDGNSFSVGQLINIQVVEGHPEVSVGDTVHIDKGVIQAIFRNGIAQPLVKTKLDASKKHATRKKVSSFVHAMVEEFEPKKKGESIYDY